MPARTPIAASRDRPAGPGRSARTLRKDARVARIVRAWRALTTPTASRRAGGGGRTLIACSGGADSSALVIALAAASDDLVVAHVVHDLRPRAHALADRDAARALAASLGLEFVEAEVSASGPPASAAGASNAEARARRGRYAALRRLAAENRCRFVATAHHADDQLETMLMAVLRGAGPRGMSGVALSRTDGRGPGAVTVVRPLLGDGAEIPACTRADTEAVCRLAGWAWREDATNADTRLLRNALRAEVLPILEKLRPGASGRAVRAAGLLRGAADVVRTAAAALHAAGDVGREGGGGGVWSRATLRAAPEVVLGEWLRLACAADGRAGLDRLTRRAVAPAVRAVRDSCTDPRTFTLAGRRLTVTARTVRLSPA